MRLHPPILLLALLAFHAVGLAQHHPLPLTLSPPPVAVRQEGSVRALVIGLGRYQHSAYSELRYPRRDAEAFAAFLRTPAGGAVTEENLMLLTDENATLAHATNALAALAEDSRREDKLIVWFSGYAAPPSNGNDARLLFFDAPAAPAEAGALDLSQVRTLLEEAAARHEGMKIFLQTEFRWFLPNDGIAKIQLPSWSGTSKKNASYAVRIAVPGTPSPPDQSIHAKGPVNGERFISYGNALLYGLLGLADRDQDRLVCAKELVYFAREQGKTAIAAGQYGYLVFSDKEDCLCKFEESNQASLTAHASGALTPLVHLEVQPLDAYIAAHADTITQELYQDFILLVRLGHLLTPASRCAASLLDSLMQRDSLAAIRRALQRRMAVAYQDDAQQALNAYLQTSREELTRRRKNPVAYKLYPIYLQRTIDLLGKKHFMYRLLEAKRLYFEGLALRLESDQVKDTSLLRQALDRQRRAIALEPEAAFVYNEIGVLLTIMQDYGEASAQYRQAIELSPTWSIPHGNLSLVLTRQKKHQEAIQEGITAISLSPFTPNAYYALGDAYMDLDSLVAAAKLYERALRLDPELPGAYYNLACIRARQHRAEEALEFLRKAFIYDFDQRETLLADHDLDSLRDQPAFERLMREFFPGIKK